MRPLRIVQALLLLLVLSSVSVTAQSGRNDSPDNQAAWRLISRAQAASAFAVTNMKIVLHFTITHESGDVETGTFINEASSAYGSREELRESNYLEETFFLPGDIEAIVGPYRKPPERIVKARRIASPMAHVKVGPFYSADHFGSLRDTEIDGLAAECVSFDRDLRDFYGPGRGQADKGEICFDDDSGVMLRHTTNGQTWFYSDYSEFAGKLLAHRIIFEALPHYRMEGTVQFSTVDAGSQADFQPPPGAAIIHMEGHPRQ